MAENNLSYILQIITILITLTLGLISVRQTRKIQHGQNIISVTTNYRLKRTEQLKEFSQYLMANTNPILLNLNADNKKMLYEANNAAEGISSVLHRYFDADRELIELADSIAQLAYTYNNTDKNTEKVHCELIYKRQLFKIKSDMYTTSEWNRIKSETMGVNTSSESWIEYHSGIAKAFEYELKRIKSEYEESIMSISKNSGV